jgi:Galactose mutarotase and related enzymes
MKKVLLILAISMMMAGCNQKKEVQLLNVDNFNKEIDGKKVSLYTLHNGNITMQVTNFGGRVVSLWTPDRRGSYEDVVLGYDNIDQYVNNTGERFLGAVVGRCANRISNGSFVLNDSTYILPKNDGENTLHGGLKGTDMVVWDVVSANDSCLVMNTVLPDGQDGFPGNLDITMTYSLNNDGFRIDYLATTDKTTVCNLSHHSFFNLKGMGNGTILDHELMINSRYMTPIKENLIPTGGFQFVKDTPFDFKQAHAIGDNINQENQQLANGKGYDHNWIIDSSMGDEVVECAVLYEPKSGRELQVWSDQMGMQFYSGNFFDGKAIGKYGKAMNYREALALETQKFPDGPNQKNYPSTILEPGSEYHQTCIYKFSVRPKE